jgi:hypothetical protein
MKLAPARRMFRIVAIIAIVIIVDLIAVRRNGSERQIEGKALSDWVRMLGDSQVRNRAHRILTAQGPHFIPELLREIDRTRGFSARAENKALTVGRFLRLNVSDPVPWNVIRGELFMVISEIAMTQRFSTNPVPELKIAVDATTKEFLTDATNANFYAVLLGRFGDHAQIALPVLMGALRSKPTSAAVLAGISEIGPGPFSSEVISIATNNLFFGDEFLRHASIRAIGRCGTNGISAVPFLVKAINFPSRANSKEALAALALIGSPPVELKSRLKKIIEQGGPDDGEAALAMLRIDPTDPLALGIVRVRLDPRIDSYLHNRVISVVAFSPPLAALFEPELQKIAARTNTTSSLARYALANLRATNSTSIK